MRLVRTEPAPTPADVPVLPVDSDASDGLWLTLGLAGMAVAVLAPDTTVAWANPKLADLTGHALDAVVGRPLAASLGAQPGDRVAVSIARVTRQGQQLVRLPVTVSDHLGTTRDLVVSAARTTLWPAPDHSVVVIEHVPTPVARPASTQDLSSFGSGDALTGLPGRATFESLLASALRDAANAGQPFALLYCDLDDFGAFNERHGARTGDQALQWVASRLSATLRHHDTIGRLGGDEFVIIAEQVPDVGVARAVARRLQGAVSETTIGSERLTISIGLTMAVGLERPVDLLAEADRVLRAAKERGAGTVLALDDLAAPVAGRDPAPA